jgi:hypothetical protein
MPPKNRQFVGDEERRRKQRDLKRRYRERRKVRSSLGLLGSTLPHAHIT